MTTQTSIANNLDHAGDEAMLDRNAKKIFSHEAVLAPLMRMCIPEFKDYTDEYIIANCFEEKPEVSSWPVHQDEGRNLDGDQRITQMNAEDSAESERTIHYDIRFSAKLPQNRQLIKLIINVEIQVEKRLVPGDIVSMSYDCNSHLHERFSTDYVLIIQNDGFPLRTGLDEFVEAGYDFIGAPHCRPSFVPSLLTRLLRYCPSNGGFSLRSRRLCRLASKLWEFGRFASRPYVEDVIAEDYFYTKTLPLSGLGNWLCRSQASSALSDRFSYGATFPLTAKTLPFGFHTATAFGAIQCRFGLGVTI